MKDKKLEILLSRADNYSPEEKFEALEDVEKRLELLNTLVLGVESITQEAEPFPSNNSGGNFMPSFSFDMNIKFYSEATLKELMHIKKKLDSKEY